MQFCQSLFLFSRKYTAGRQALDQLSTTIDQFAEGAQEQGRMMEKNVTTFSQV